MPVEVWASPGVVVPAVERQVRELADRSDDEIGTVLGVSPRTAKRLRHALGILRAPSPADLVPDAELRRLQARGMTRQQIADETGLTVGSVSTRLSRLQLKAARAEARTETLPIRWTPTEARRVQAAAELADETVSDLVRRLVLEQLEGP